MFRHTSQLQFTSKPERPDALYAMKLQELIGGAWGEMTVSQQYLFQGWNCRVPGKYKDMIMDIATEEIGHVEMLATMVARLLEGAPAETTARALDGDAATAAIIGGMNPQHAIVGGGGAQPADSVGVPWNGRYIVSSGNLLADFRVNVAAESQGRLQTARLYNMTDDPGAKEMLKFNLARDTMHQMQWLAAIEQLQEDGLEGVVVPRQDPQGLPQEPRRDRRQRRLVGRDRRDRRGQQRAHGRGGARRPGALPPDRHARVPPAARGQVRAVQVRARRRGGPGLRGQGPGRVHRLRQGLTDRGPGTPRPVATGRGAPRPASDSHLCGRGPRTRTPIAPRTASASSSESVGTAQFGRARRGGRRRRTTGGVSATASSRA